MSDGARDAIVVTIDLAPEDDSLAAIATQLPEPSTLAPGTRVSVSAARAQKKGFLARLRTPPPVPAALRASALLARGYASIEADGDRVTALTPPPLGR